jgi:hypothetical protein
MSRPLYLLNFLMTQSDQLEWPSKNFAIDKLLNPDAGARDSEIRQCLSDLELVLFQSHKDLYLECFHARLSLSTLHIHSAGYTDFWLDCPISYPTFGKDIPAGLVEHVRHVTSISAYVRFFYWHKIMPHPTRQVQSLQ